jgi:hypothetical protein
MDTDFKELDCQEPMYLCMVSNTKYSRVFNKVGNSMLVLILLTESIANDLEDDLNATNVEATGDKVSIGAVDYTFILITSSNDNVKLSNWECMRVRIRNSKTGSVKVRSM